VASAPPASRAFDSIETRDVTRHFGSHRALARLSLRASAGQVVGLFGPNGAGKSTLLNILSTLMRPTSGEVHYGDRGAREWGDDLRGHIGLLGHDLFLYGDLTARENLEFFARLYGVRDPVGRAAAAIAAARLDARAGDRVLGFSRGLRQRLALERALIHDPRLVLLDEPFTGLDDESSAVLRDRLAALRASGAIVVMATHDFEQAEGLVTDAWCLNHGRATPMIAGGSMRERYRQTLAGAARA
jgi:heme exporter protein A